QAMPIGRGRRGMRRRLSAGMSTPATSTSPSVGISSRYRSRRSVVLPAPLGPLRTTNSPFSMPNVMSARAVCLAGPAPKVFPTWWSLIMACRPFYLRKLLYFRKFLPQKLVHQRRIRLALRRLHHLAHQEAQGGLLAVPPVLHDFGVLSQHLVHHTGQGVDVGHLGEPLSADDGPGIFTGPQHLFEHVFGNFPADG